MNINTNLEFNEKRYSEIIEKIAAERKEQREAFNEHARYVIYAETVQTALNIPYEKWIKRHDK